MMPISASLYLFLYGTLYICIWDCRMECLAISTYAKQLLDRPGALGQNQPGLSTKIKVRQSELQGIIYSGFTR